MNKTAIKNFAIWARNKLIADIRYKAGLFGITEKGIKSALPQSTKDVQFFDIGTKEPYSISGIEIKQREKLMETINNKAKQSDHGTAYKAVIEEVAYTWFNRLIAVRFMEVNDYLPSRIRVLSSESDTKIEPDLVTTPFDTDLDFSPYEKDRIVQLTHETRLDELFHMLFIKQCNELNAILPNLFEKTNDYTELLLNVSFTDKDGVVYHLVHDIPEIDFRIRTEADEDAIRAGKMTEEEAPRGQVEIIGWLYQYYNTEPKYEAFALLKKNVKITKERIPAATQLFTPDWIVRYMVENSLGRLWINVLESSFGYTYPSEYALRDVSGRRTIDVLKSNWKYYIEEVEQTEDVEFQLEKVLESYRGMKLEDIKVIDPCMGSAHILVYAFDVLMQIYESCGYSQRDAAKNILIHNIYGLDIDNRAYQLAYFALMMKARQYNRRILDGETDCHVYSIQESNSINRDHLKYFGTGMSEIERNIAILQVQGLLDTFVDAKEYGSILNVENYNWDLLNRFVGNTEMSGQLSMDVMGIEDTKEQLCTLVEIGATMAQKYDVVVTNPPYMGSGGMDGKLLERVKTDYPDTKADMSTVMMEKSIDMSKVNGYLSMINIPVWMTLAGCERFREKLIKNNSLINMLHFGRGVFGSDFGSTAFVFTNRKLNNYFGLYQRLFLKQGAVDSVEQKEKWFFEGIGKFLSNQDNYLKIPGYAFTYQISKKVYDHFETAKKVGSYGSAKQGLITGSNDLFLRFWFEVSTKNMTINCKSRSETVNNNIRWYPYNKGGEFKKWFGNCWYVVDWFNDGFSIQNFYDDKGKLRSRPQNMNYYFYEGLTWTALTAGKFSMRYSPSGFIFDAMGPVCFIFDKIYEKYILGLLNSIVGNMFLRILCPNLKFDQKPLENVPCIVSNVSYVNSLVDECITIAKNDWDSYEFSWGFRKHPIVEQRKNTSYISEALMEINKLISAQRIKLKKFEELLNIYFLELYELNNEINIETDDENITISECDLDRDIRGFISYAIGCMFGRYSLDIDGLAYAGGEWDDNKYISFMPDKDNIIPITDEEYFEDDVVGLFVAFVKKVYGENTLEENLDFIAKSLGNKGNTSREIIRNYFVKDFFKDHCKVYQKRPIYWLFDSGKADGFKALIYMHRYDENTIGNLRIDYLHRMQRVYESEIARMQNTIENSTNNREVTAAEKRKEKLTKQLKETKEYDAKIAHLALARIAIDLDDGVAVNYEKVQTDAEGKKLDVLAKI